MKTNSNSCELLMKTDIQELLKGIAAGQDLNIKDLDFNDDIKNLFNGKINTWDYQWSLSSFLNSGLTIVPNKNLIKNIGFDEEATHTFEGEANTFIEKDNENYNEIFPTVHPDHFIINKKADEIVDILEYSGGNKLSKIFLNKKLKNLRIKMSKFLKNYIYKK